jgi:pyruvate,water dikinase
MAVVVQQMVRAEASGVLFTADPVTSSRRVVSVEATVGLGDDFVSGRAVADVFTVRDGAIVAGSRGGERAVVDARPALTDDQVLRLAERGRRIEAHFGRPQDIEWCLAGGTFQFVQSRPITTLFPVPVVDDDERHVYVSVGHQQMMTDPIRPLGLSVWQLTALRPMHTAGGRLFVDVTAMLASPSSRVGLLDALGRSEPLVRDALETIVDRGDFLTAPADDGPEVPTAGGPPPIGTDPAIVAELVERTRASVAELRRAIASKSGAELLDVVRADLQELQRLLADPRSHQVIMAGMEASWWLDDHLEEWLGERNAAGVLTQSVPGNVTSEMGLALLDVADVVRPHPEVVAFLEQVDGDDFLAELALLPGGREVGAAIEAYLDEYGMRCVGEIDITRPRWSERPSALVPVILADVRNFETGAAARRFEQGRQEAAAKEQEVLERLRGLSDGARKADETARMIERVRTFAGYREYPKYGIVSRYAIYKRALLDEAERLARAGVIREPDDISFLTLDELDHVVRTGELDPDLVERREAEFATYAALTPPRVLTSDGEALNGRYRRDDVPVGALVGLAVSTGDVEGRARVVLDMAEADVRPGDILVTTHTDPSWSPLFVTVAGLVTEVGGLMTHGAVIAREYGLPAVVGVGDATRSITDGQRIRVNGTDGYVEVLSPT